MTVQALSGDPMWALPDYQDRGTTAIQKAADYNAKVTAPIERFVGVQFDVEPHGLNGNNGYPDRWNTDRVGTIKTWLDNARIWTAQARRLGLRFGAAMLAFLDNTTNYPVPPEYASAGSRVSDIVTDIHDYVVVMGYRDTAQAVYDLDIDEVSYAKTPKVIVAFESTAQTPTNVTFMEEGFFAMEASMAAVHGMLKSQPGYKGVAVHAFRQWEPFIAAVGPKAPVRSLNKVR
ncbi:hypothetical protein [Paenibacillus sp. SN-8-1]|uniref:hypothetical protein n=1 Tax=Paenibacillus sp. SN-8-1 TaxID=3435409 RepID=UPI003D9A1FCE